MFLHRLVLHVPVIEPLVGADDYHFTVHDAKSIKSVVRIAYSSDFAYFASKFILVFSEHSSIFKYNIFKFS